MLSSPTVLLRASSSVVGVTAGVQTHELIATLHSQGIALYDARTQACIKTWPTRAGVQLTHAACMHPSTGRLIGVRDHSVLFGWERNGEIDFESCTQTVSAPVLSMLHHPSLLDGVVVVLVDGSAVIFDASLSRQLGTVPRPVATAPNAAEGDAPARASRAAQRQQQGQGTAVDASVRRPRRVVLAAAAGCRAPLRCPHCPGHPRGGGRALGVLRRTNRPVSSLRRPHASLAAFKANGQRHGGALGAIDGRGAGARASAATHPAAVRGRLQRRRGAHARRLLLGSWWGGWPGS